MCKVSVLVALIIFLPAIQFKEAHSSPQVEIVVDSASSLSLDKQVILKEEVSLVWSSYKTLFGMSFPSTIKLYLDKQKLYGDYPLTRIFHDPLAFTLIDYNHTPPILYIYINIRWLNLGHFNRVSTARIAIISHEIGHHFFPSGAARRDPEAIATVLSLEIVKHLAAKGILPKSEVTSVTRQFPFSHPFPYFVFFRNLVQSTDHKVLARISHEFYRKIGIRLLAEQDWLCPQEIEQIWNEHTHGMYKKLSFGMIENLGDTLFSEEKDGLIVVASPPGFPLREHDKVVSIAGKTVNNIKTLKKVLMDETKRIPLSWQYNSYPVPFTVRRDREEVKINAEIRRIDFKAQLSRMVKELRWETISQKPIKIKFTGLPRDDANQFAEMFQNAIGVLRDYGFPVNQFRSLFIMVIDANIPLCSVSPSLYPIHNYKGFVLISYSPSQSLKSCTFHFQNQIVRDLLSTISGFDPNVADGIYFLAARALARKDQVLEYDAKKSELSDLIGVFFPDEGSFNMKAKGLYYRKYPQVLELFLKLENLYGQDGIATMVRMSLSKCDLAKKDRFIDTTCVHDDCVIRYHHLASYVRSHPTVDHTILSSIESLASVSFTPPISYEAL